MKLTLTNFKLRQELDRVYVLHWTHFSFLLLALLIELVKFESITSNLVQIVLVCAFYRLYYLTIKKLYYTFWTFSAVLIGYLLISLFSFEELTMPFYLYFLSLIFVVCEMYILHNPIYYPIVSWWEYDFRYRHDLKIEVDSETKKGMRGRLTDLRRYSGAIQLFEDLEIGSQLTITHGEETYKGEVMSKRLYSVGRPWTYGFKFDFDDQSQRRNYEGLLLSYKNEKNKKVQSKFKKTTV